MDSHILSAVPDNFIPSLGLSGLLGLMDNLQPFTSGDGAAV